jgi:hypothetical protein
MSEREIFQKNFPMMIIGKPELILTRSTYESFDEKRAKPSRLDFKSF